MIQRLIRHSFWLFLARIGTQVGMAIFTILLARQLGSERFGEYAFIASLLVVGNMVTTFGTDMFLIREIAASDDLSPIPAALGLQLLLSTLFVAGIVLSSRFFTFQSSEGIRAVQIYSLALFPLAFFTVCTIALRGKQQMGAYTILNLLQAATQVIVILILNFLDGGLILLAWLLFGSQFVAAVVAGILCMATIPNFWGAWGYSICGSFKLAQASTPMALLSTVGVVYQRLTLTLLPFLAGAAETGIFSVSARVVEMAKIGHIAVFTAIYPIMAFNRTQKSNWFLSFRLPWLILIVTAVFAALSLSALAAPLVRWLFGMEYTPSIPVLQILVWALVPYTINNFLSLAFLVDVREPIITGALTISLLCLFIFTIWWGQNSGALGTAWAVVSAETIQCIILSFRAMRHREWFSFKGSDFKGSDFKGSDLKGSGNEFSNLS